MTDRCFEPEELGGILQLDAGDPRRHHIDTCPRCQSRLIVYREFLEDTSVPEGARRGEAAARLRAAFQAEVTPTLSTRRERPPTESWWARMFRPALRPAWAGVGVLAIALVAYTGYRAYREAAAPDLLRGAGPRRGAGITLYPARTQADGALVLRWGAFAGADAYRVRVLGIDLADLATLGPVADTSIVVRSDQLPKGLPHGSAVGWQVDALAAGQIIATSPTGTAQLP